MIDELSEILNREPLYKKSDVNIFIQTCQEYIGENNLINNEKILVVLDEKHSNMFNKSLLEASEKNNKIKSFIKKHITNVSKKQEKEIKQKISQLKSELPTKLMFFLELDAGNIKDREGESITIKDYSNASSVSALNISNMIKDAKKILKVKLIRSGISPILLEL